MATVFRVLAGINSKELLMQRSTRKQLLTDAVEDLAAERWFWPCALAPIRPVQPDVAFAMSVSEKSPPLYSSGRPRTFASA